MYGIFLEHLFIGTTLEDCFGVAFPLFQNFAIKLFNPERRTTYVYQLLFGFSNFWAISRCF